MIKRIVLTLLIISLIIPSIFAWTTSINVISKNGYDITVNVINVNSGDLVTTFNEVVGTSGQVNFTLVSENAKVDLIVIGRTNGKITSKKEFKGYSTASPIIINMNSAPPKPVTTPPKNTTNTSTPPVTTPPVTTPPATTPPQTNTSSNVNMNKSSNISGNTISGEGMSVSLSWRVIIIVFVSIIVIAIVLFLIIFFLKRRKYKSFDSSPGYKIKSLKDHSLKVNYNPRVLEDEKTLRQAEEKIRLAQEEINRIKYRKDKVRELEKRMAQDKYELEKLKRGR
ncbi:MAG: hypothetical protein Q8N99_06040 [Nanoarchaeota archaeon]|nr:hypothetical protein [Nanoarchaeota archaeon]